MAQNKNTVGLFTKNQLGEEEVKFEQILLLDQEAEKILSVQPFVQVENVEHSNQEVCANAKMCVKVLCLGADKKILKTLNVLILQ